MLETISQGFSSAKNILRKETTLGEHNIKSALKEVRLALLEADVEYGVVKSFISKVKERALGLVIKTQVKDAKGTTHKLSPSEHFIGICYEELQQLMGPEQEALKLPTPLASFMMVGLQGSGKTTTTAKLARYLVEEHKKKPLLVAADIYRPGAAQQLAILGQRLDIPVFHQENLSAQEICSRAHKKAKEENFSAIIYDTAGRLAIDEALMGELEDIKKLVSPEHIYLVIDSMIGQDAVQTAASFDNKLDISGSILTKLDGDSRGGAALSIRSVTEKPIVFLGLGEDLASLEPFRPQGLASRILGMGDIVSLTKDFEKHVDEKEAEEDMKRLMAGSFSFDDFIKQLNMIRKLGSFKSILDRMPGFSDMLPKGQTVNENEIIKFESMIFSMTPQERKLPDLLTKQKTRRIRVAQGSGRDLKETDALLERFMMMRRMMQSVGKNPSLLSKLPMFKNMGNMAQIAQNYGGAENTDIQELMSSMGSPMPGSMGGFGPQRPQNTIRKPKISNKQKKDSRKKQKVARKKNKKKK